MGIKPIDLKKLYETHRSSFDRYCNLLLKWNQKISLTAITDPHKIVELHFMDSLSALPLIVSRETSLSLLDIGAGAGFPGLPLKIACPRLQLTLIDSVKKKCDFMKEVVRQLQLKGIQILHGRATTEAPVEGAPFDVVISRAAFKLKELLPIARINLREGGLFIAMKGPEISNEIQESLGAGTVLEQIHYQLPFSGKKRSLIFMN